MFEASSPKKPAVSASPVDGGFLSGQCKSYAVGKQTGVKVRSCGFRGYPGRWCAARVWFSIISLFTCYSWDFRHTELMKRGFGAHALPMLSFLPVSMACKYHHSASTSASSCLVAYAQVAAQGEHIRCYVRPSLSHELGRLCAEFSGLLWSKMTQRCQVDASSWSGDGHDTRCVYFSQALWRSPEMRGRCLRGRGQE